MRKTKDKAIEDIKKRVVRHITYEEQVLLRQKEIIENLPTKGKWVDVKLVKLIKGKYYFIRREGKNNTPGQPGIYKWQMPHGGWYSDGFSHFGTIDSYGNMGKVQVFVSSEFEIIEEEIEEES